MEKVIELSHKEFLKIDKDYSKAAKVADLIYVLCGFFRIPILCLC